jgi:hypothetical protein
MKIDFRENATSMPMEDVTDLTSEEPATTTELEGSMISCTT